MHSRISLSVVVLSVAILLLSGCGLMNEPKPLRLEISFFITNAVTSSPISGATVDIIKHSYGESDKTITVQSNSTGATAMVAFTTLSTTGQQTCDIVVRKEGYQDYRETITYEDGYKLTPHNVKMPPS